MSKWQEAGFPDKLHLADPSVVLGAICNALAERDTWATLFPDILANKTNSVHSCVDRIDTWLSRGGPRRYFLYANGSFWTIFNKYIDTEELQNQFFFEVCDLLKVPYVPYTKTLSSVYSVNWALSRYHIINAMFAVPIHEFNGFIVGHREVWQDRDGLKQENEYTNSSVGNWYEKINDAFHYEYLDLTTYADFYYQLGEWSIIPTAADVNLLFEVSGGEEYDDFGSGLKPHDKIKFFFKKMKHGESRRLFGEEMFSGPTKHKPDESYLLTHGWSVKTYDSEKTKYEIIRKVSALSSYADHRPYLQYYDPPES